MKDTVCSVPFVSTDERGSHSLRKTLSVAVCHLRFQTDSVANTEAH